LERTSLRRHRRDFLTLIGSTSVAAAAGVPPLVAQQPNSQSVPDFPDMRTFRQGDLIWPKRKRSLVPQARSAQPKQNDERTAWEAARGRLLADPQGAGLAPEVAERLKGMSFTEYEREYYSVTDLPRSGPVPRGALPGPISVGHVGMIQVERNGGAFIVEAIPSWRGVTHNGVVRLPYAEWLGGYSNIQVWHGRLRGLDRQAGGKLLDVALGQLVKPYDFFNFDLNDDSGFYCSKLVWMCAWRALKVALDDNPDPHRGGRFPPWFSPKALIGVRHIELLHSPGAY
jgi:hypothetical protein